jgi:hypothetical protein
VEVALDGAKIAAKLIEYPELVADRIITFAEIVGQENVIAGTDCGLGGRVPPQIAWPSCAPARRGRAREQVIVELNSIMIERDERKEKAKKMGQERSFRRNQK